MEYLQISDYLCEKFTLQDMNIDAKIFTAPVKDILSLYYVAVRGRDEEEGAVQRILNPRRIRDIRDFILKGNQFFSSFILNWASSCPIEYDGHTMRIPLVARSAQVIDGQHRLEGFKEAIKAKESVGETKILITLVQNLPTAQAANIFLNINSEQKSVPKSLIYDLFGEVEKNSDHYLVRADDLAKRLQDDFSSPYFQCVKLPGAPRGSGTVDFSAMVSALKAYTGQEGGFHDFDLDDLESQYRVILNFFNVLRAGYDHKEGEWFKRSTNPFMTNAGFRAGVEFLFKRMMPQCAAARSFQVEFMQKLLPLERFNLMERSEIKNMGGGEQREHIYQYLSSVMESTKEKETSNGYLF